MEWIWLLPLACVCLFEGTVLAPALRGQDASAIETAHLVPQFNIKDAKALAFSPDDRTLAVATGNTAQLWDVATGLSVRTLEDPEGEVKSVVFSHNGEFLLTTSRNPDSGRGSSGDATRIWDVKTGQQIHLFTGRGPAVFSPDDRFLAESASSISAADPAGHVLVAELREIATGKLVQSFYAEMMPDYLEVSPDNKLLLVGDRNQPAVVFSIDTGKPLHELKAQPNPQPPTFTLTFAVFSKDGKSIYTGEENSNDTQIRGWDAAKGQKEFALKSKTGAFDGVLSADGRYLTTGDYGNRTISVWDMFTQKLARNVSTGCLSDTSIIFCPDNGVFAAGYRLNVAASSAMDRSSLLIFDTVSGQALRKIGDASPTISKVAANDTFHALFFGYQQDSTVWDTASGTPILDLNLHKYHFSVSSISQSLAASSNQAPTASSWGLTEYFQMPRDESTFSSFLFSPTEGTALSGSQAGGLQLFDLSTTQKEAGFSTSSLLVANRNTPSQTFSVKVKDAAYSPDGSKIAVALADSSVRILDAHTGSETGVLSGPSLANIIDQTRNGDSIEITSVSFLPGDKAFRTANSLGSTVTDIGSGSRTGWEGGIGRVLAQSADARFVLAVVINSSVPDVNKFDLIDRKTTSETMLDFPAGFLSAAAFSPDGKQVLVEADSGALRSWDTATGKKVLDLPGRNIVEALALGFAADGSRIVSLEGVMGGLNLRVWDAATGNELRTIPQIAKGIAVGKAAFSQNGLRLLIGSAWDGDDQVSLWDAETGKLIRTFAGTTRRTLAVAISPDGQLCAGEASDGSVRVWDGESGRTVMDAYSGEYQTGNDLQGWAIAFSSDGKKLLSAGSEGSVSLWDVTSGKRIRSFEGHTGSVTSVAYSKDGGHILTTSIDGSVRLWDASTKEPLLRMSAENPRIHLLALSPDGHLAATGGYTPEVRLWDARTGALLRSFTGHHDFVNSINFSPDGSQLLTGSWDSTARLSNPRTGETIRIFAGHTEMVLSTAFSSDGALIATGSRDKTVKVWESSTGKLLHTFTGHTNSVTSVEFSPDGRFVASSSFDGTVRIWSLETGEATAVFAEGKGTVYVASFAAGGTRLAAISEDSKLRIWDVATKTLVHVFDEPVRAQALAVFPDGKTAALGDDEHLVRIVNLETGEAARRLENHTAAVNAVAVSADGRIVLSGSDDHTARVWDSRTGALLQTLGSDSNAAYTATFSEDGQRALAGYANGDVYEWDLKSGETLHVYRGGSAVTRSVTYAGNERFVFGGGDDSIARLWDRETGKQVASLMSLSNGTWAVIDPDGRFDTNDLDGGTPLHWVLSSDPLNPLPLEIFMRDYYTPRLLARIMEGEDLPPVRSITAIKNRVQPEVKIVSVTPSSAHAERVDVVVRAASRKEEKKNANGVVEKGPDGKPMMQLSGLQDLRLFRNGQLAANTPLGHSLEDSEFSFNDIQLPTSTSTKTVTFTAYAFNSERIKSPTASKEFTYEPGVQAKAHAYLLQIGVNHYQASGCELHGSATDAEELSKALSERLAKRGLDVKGVRLVSTDTESGATKDGIRDALKAIAAEATPDDVFFLSFSGHGYGDKSGQFYILPSDIQGSCSGVDKKLLDSAISADELAEWLRPIDAGEMTFVLDACDSASSVEANDFKPGPMGSSGLGQLAYDKRMRILAASQPNQAAHESDLLHQGLLSYVLTQEGLVEGKADWKPVDKKITVGEWLSYAADAVPKFDQAQTTNGNTKGITLEGIPALRARSGQIPAVFDFSKSDNFALQ